MITLCGFSMSNYYNKVKLALLEKGIEFTEETVMTKSSDEAVLAASPLGKIPFIRTEHGTLCESQVIVEYVDALSSAQPLLPADPWAAAKVRELVTFVDLHLELVARELYPQAFFGGKIGRGDTRRACASSWSSTSPASSAWRSSRPTSAGDTFTQADCAAYVSLPLVGMATQGGLRRRPAGRRRHRLEGLRQAHRRAAERAARGRRPQGRNRAHGGGTGQALKAR